MLWFDIYNEFIKNIDKINQLQQDYIRNLERVNQLYDESIKRIEKVNELYNTFIDSYQKIAISYEKQLLDNMQSMNQKWHDVLNSWEQYQGEKQ